MKNLYCFHHHQFLPCRPPLPQGAGASGPGEAFWCSQGLGCSSRAREQQLSGWKCQPSDSAVPLPTPRAGSSCARGCLPAHKVPDIWCWALNYPSSIFSPWGGGGLGGGQDTLQHPAWGAGICSTCWFPGLGQHVPAMGNGEGGLQEAVAGGILQVKNIPGSKVPISAPRCMLAFSTSVGALANSKVSGPC